MTIHWSGAARAAIPATSSMLLTPEQAAVELQIARRRIFELIKSGELPSVKIGKSRRIRRDDLATYVAGLSSDAA